MRRRWHLRRLTASRRQRYCRIPRTGVRRAAAGAPCWRPFDPNRSFPIASFSLRSAYGLRNGVGERLQAAPDVRAQVRTQRTALAFGQNLEIAARLRRFHNAESVLLAGHRQIVGVVASDLEEHAGVRTALVSLPGGMQKTRTE